MGWTHRYVQYLVYSTANLGESQSGAFWLRHLTCFNMYHICVVVFKCLVNFVLCDFVFGHLLEQTSSALVSLDVFVCLVFLYRSYCVINVK